MEKRKATIKTLDDIQRERDVRERSEAKEHIVEDIKDVMGKLTMKEKPTKRRLLWRIVKWGIGALLFIFLLVMLANFILLNIWALKFFIKSLFLS